MSYSNGNPSRIPYRGPIFPRGVEKQFNCELCPAALNMTLVEFRQHMVTVHGYQQVGNSVFKRYPCIACPKPGLYRVGNVNYCSDHKHLATTRRVEHGKYLNEIGVEGDQHFDAKDKLDRAGRKHHKVAGIRRRPVT